MGSPARRDLEIYRGDDYSHQITFVDANNAPLDVSAYTFTAEIRDRSEGGAQVYATFTVDMTQAATGIITLHLAAADTRIKTDVAYWDLQVDTGSAIQTWLAGKVTASGDVTHP